MGTNIVTKIVIFLLILVLLGLSIFFVFSESQVKQQIIEEEKLESKNFDNLPYFFARNMHEALTDGEKKDLSTQWGLVMAYLGNTTGLVNNLKNQGVSSNPLKELDIILADTQRTAQEIISEIKSSAESLDDKAESVKNNAFKMKKLSEQIKTKTVSLDELANTIIKFITETNKFINMLTNARRIDPRFPEKREAEEVFKSLMENPINATNSSTTVVQQ